MTITFAKFTVEDYHRLVGTGVFEGRSVELLEGWIVEMAPEAPGHSDVIRESADWFRENLGNQAKVSEAHPVTLPESEPEPDIALVVNQRYRDRHPSAQDIFLIIEVADSSLGKDLNEKVRAYASTGILEYWLVDLVNSRVIVMRQPEGDRYLLSQEYTTGTICPLQFPNLAVPVDILLGN
jgi:Uma2 family endonuclease